MVTKISLNFADLRDNTSSESHFEPMAVMEHTGNMTRDGDGQGHYICDVKFKETKTWYRTNDNNNPVPISSQSVTKNAVVILYKRK